MSKCANCGATLSCGCQKRVSSTGQQACTKCIHTLTPKAAPNRAQSKINN